MRLLHLSAVALAVETAYGYLDTSPFFMFSTSELLSSTTKLQTASSVASDISRTLSQCPSDFYILVSQAGVTAKDYKSRKSTPALARLLSSESASEIRSSVSIPEIVGGIDPVGWQDVLESTCGVQTTEIDASTGSIPTTYDMLPRLINVYFPSLSQSAAARTQEISQNDAFFASILDLLPTQNYTVLYTTTPNRSPRRLPVGTETKVYAMDSEIQELLHMDLKRDVSSVHALRKNNQTMIDGPLFDKYQFFTPGIWMGFSVGLLLLSILYVAISAVASLQVSYAAFDKESGPLASKKQQ